LYLASMKPNMKRKVSLKARTDLRFMPPPDLSGYAYLKIR
jgi:hypothetical protein